MQRLKPPNLKWLGAVTANGKVGLLKTPRAAIGTFFFLQGLCAATFVSRIPEMQTELGLTDTRLGFAVGFVACGGLLTLPLAGLAVSRWGSRRVLVAASLCHGLLLAGVGQVAAWPLLLAVLACFGMANTAVQISVNAQAVAAERALGRSILASFHGLWSVAGFFGALLSTGALAHHVSRSQHFLGLFAFMAVTAVSCAPNLAGPTGQAMHNSCKRPPRLRAGWPPEPYLVRLALLTFGAMFCESVMFDWSGVFFSQWVSADPLWVGLSYSVFMAAMAGGRFVADCCVARLGVQRVLSLGGLLLTLGYALCVALPYRASALLGFAFNGLGVCAMVPLIMAQTGRAERTALGVALAFVSTVGFVGAFVGPLFVGLVADWLGLRVAFAGVGVVGLGIGAWAGKLLQGPVARQMQQLVSAPQR